MPQPRPDDAAPFSRAQASRNAARAAAEAILVNGNGRRAAAYGSSRGSSRNQHRFQRIYFETGGHAE
jgi:hypothetical protein